MPEDDSDISVKPFLVPQITGIADFNAKMHAAGARFDEEKKNLWNLLKEFQRYCTHDETTYNPDPSGNNDSWHECVRCGADVTAVERNKRRG